MRQASSCWALGCVCYREKPVYLSAETGHRPLSLSQSFFSSVHSYPSQSSSLQRALLFCSLCVEAPVQSMESGLFMMWHRTGAQDQSFIPSEQKFSGWHVHLTPLIPFCFLEMQLNFPLLTIVSSGKYTALLGHTWSLHDRGYYRNRNWKSLCIKLTRRSLKLSWLSETRVTGTQNVTESRFHLKIHRYFPFPLGGMESCWHPTDGYRLRFKCVYA